MSLRDCFVFVVRFQFFATEYGGELARRGVFVAAADPRAVCFAGGAVAIAAADRVPRKGAVALFS